jgi:hypothetical protein
LKEENEKEKEVEEGMVGEQVHQPFLLLSIVKE